MITISRLTNTRKATLALALAAGLLLTSTGVAQAGNPGCDGQGRPIVYWDLGAGYAGTVFNVYSNGVPVGSVTLDANGRGSVVVGEAGQEYNNVEFESPGLTNGRAPVGGTGRVYCLPPVRPEEFVGPADIAPPAPTEEEYLIVPETDTTDVAETAS